MAHAQKKGYAKEYNKGDRKRFKRKKELEKEQKRREKIKYRYLRLLPWPSIMLWAVLSYLEEKKSVRKIADIIGVSRSTIYNWINRYKEGGKEALEYKSRRPRRIKTIEPEVIEKIVELYNKGMGCIRIAYELGIGHMTVWRYLVKLKILKPREYRQRKYKIFERNHSNSLWQMDLTCIDRDEKIWALAIIDDHSRFVIEFKVIFGDPSVEDIIPILEEAFSRYGVPKQILTDRGTQFYTNVGNASTFDMHLESLGVKHILARVRHPQTNGKVERVMRTFKEECIFAKEWTKDTLQEVIDEYIEYYNYHRPHIIYRVVKAFGIEKKRREVILPFLRFAVHH